MNEQMEGLIQNEQKWMDEKLNESTEKEQENHTDYSLMKELEPISFSYLGNLWKSICDRLKDDQTLSNGCSIELTDGYEYHPHSCPQPSTQKEKTELLEKCNSQTPSRIDKLRLVAEKAKDYFQFEGNYRYLLLEYMKECDFSRIVIHFDDMHCFLSESSFERPAPYKRDRELSKDRLDGYKWLSLRDAICPAKCIIQFKICFSGKQVPGAQEMYFPPHIKSLQLSSIPWTAQYSKQVIEHFLDMSNVDEVFKSDLYEKLAVPKAVEYFLAACNASLNDKNASEVTAKILHDEILPKVEAMYSDYTKGL